MSRPLTAALALLLLATAPAPAAEDVPNPSGTWQWTWNDPQGQTHRHLLEIEKAGNKLAAREVFDDMAAVPVRELKLEGKTLKFVVVRGDRRAEYVGKLADASTINGTATVTSDGQSVEFVWKAEKQTRKPKAP